MDSDTCVGFKRRIMEIGDTQEALLPPLSPLPPTPQSCRIPLEDKEKQDVSENTTNNNNLSSFLSDSKKSKCSEIIINEENQELGFASGADRTLQVLESSISGCGGFVKKVEAFGEEEPKNENGEVGFVSDGEAKQGILVSGTADNEEKVFAKSETELESQSFLEVKKKKLLKDLEDKIHAEKVTDFEGSLKIEVIDETALIEVNDQCAERKGNKNGNQEVDGKKARLVTKSGDGTKKVYSRKEMEALRFANLEEQRKNWKEIYEGLGAAVAREYEDLASSKHQKQIRVNFDPRQHFGKKELAPAILREACTENMDSDFKKMENNETESLTTLDPACSHIVSGEGGTGLEEECSEDYDSDEDYASIQKPAFVVEGEPDFDSGPAEDGLEYLRRVRWEAAQIPKVKVAKLDRSKFIKEQSVYMPQIPNIAECPEHLLPLKQWEDVFLADFSELRLALSHLEGSGENISEKLQSAFVIREKPFQDVVFENFDHLVTEAVHSNQPHDCSVSETSIDQPSLLAVEDSDTSLPSEQSSPKTSADESSGPLLSAILRMDSVARVSTLRKRISSVQTMNTLSKNDCLCLFALCAVVDTPLDGDTSAAIRGLLRKCATLRASKSELDDEVVMLNILATVAGRYFGQSES
uniref:Gem-associated protein 2 n=1 Tax=Fagus sylvatica TaxID=28930 RepID=A0A2N9ELG7_FAGSY